MTHKLGKYMVAKRVARNPNVWYVCHKSFVVPQVGTQIGTISWFWGSEKFSLITDSPYVYNLEDLLSIARFLKKLNKQGRIPNNLTDETKKAPREEPNSP